MVMESLINPKTGKPYVKNVRRKVIEKHYDWGLYVYKKSNGKWFTDGEGSILNIPAERGDLSKISELGMYRLCTHFPPKNLLFFKTMVLELPVF